MYHLFWSSLHKMAEVFRQFNRIVIFCIPRSVGWFLWYTPLLNPRVLRFSRLWSRTYFNDVKGNAQFTTYKLFWDKNLNNTFREACWSRSISVKQHEHRNIRSFLILRTSNPQNPQVLLVNSVRPQRIRCSSFHVVSIVIFAEIYSVTTATWIGQSWSVTSAPYFESWI